MRKTLLLSLLLLVCGVVAKAQVVAPAISEGDNVYEYYIRFYNSGHYVKTTVGEGGNLRVAGTDKLKVKFVAAATDGYVNIIPTNVEGYNFIAAEGAVHATSAIKFYTEAQTAYSEWKFEVNMDGADRWYNLILKDGETSGLSFCLFTATATNNKQVGTYNHASSENACRIQFEAANEAAKTAAFNLARGYYKMESVGRADQYLKNDIAREDMQTLQTTTGNTNNFIWKVEVSGKTLTVLNGLGTPIKVGTTSYPTMNVAAVVAKKASDSYVFDNYLNRRNDGNVADDKTIFVWPGDGYAESNQWLFEAVAGTAYTVVLVDAPEGATVTRTVGDVTETAFNGGFFMASGETFDGTLAATHIDGYTAGEPAIDNAAKTITVKYTHNLTEYVTLLTEANDNAKALLAKTGVGYPKADDEKRLALATLTGNITTALQTPEVSLDYTEAGALETALEAYMVSTNIQMPEDGKAYTITSVNKNGVQRYMNYTEGTGYDLVDRTDDPLPMTAVLICRDLGEGKYVFTNNAGKYFMWRGGGATGYNENKGYSDTYEFNADINAEVWVEKISAEATNVTVEQDALFGYMAIKGHRNITNANDKICYFVITTAGGYDHANAMFFNDGFSSALLIEEVTTDSPSQVNFSANLSGVGYVATYSAKYPSVVPENKGIVAYYASQNTGSDVTMTPIEGAIPANTGVVLISESMQTVGMAPLAAEAPEALTTNLLRHSAGEATTISAESGKTAYILANGSEGVGFYAHDGSATQLKMNKSYLVIDTPTGGNAVKLVFGGTATGIEDAVEADDEAAPVYDLSGRKVSAPVKGGIYVKNGKKIIF